MKEPYKTDADTTTVALLRSMGPVTLDQIRREQLQQTVGVDKTNAARVARESIRRVKAAGEAINYDGARGVYDYNY